MRRTSKARTRGCFAKKFYDLPEANLSHAGECLKYGILRMANVLPDRLACPGIGFAPEINLSLNGAAPPGDGMEADAAEADTIGYELVEQYLDGLLPELNFRLFCDVEPESGYFPQTMLWLEKITMLHEEEGTSVCGREEKYCLGGRPLKGEKEAVFSEQIKYMLEKMINDFKTLWKKKGR